MRILWILIVVLAALGVLGNLTLAAEARESELLETVCYSMPMMIGFDSSNPFLSKEKPVNIEVLRKQAENEKANPELQFSFAEALCKLGRGPEAQPYFKKVADLFKKLDSKESLSAQQYASWARAAEIIGKKQDGIDLAESALRKVKAKKILLYRYLGNAYENLAGATAFGAEGDFAGAADFMSNAEELVQGGLAKNLPKAKECFKKALGAYVHATKEPDAEPLDYFNLGNHRVTSKIFETTLEAATDKIVLSDEEQEQLALKSWDWSGNPDIVKAVEMSKSTRAKAMMTISDTARQVIKYGQEAFEEWPEDKRKLVNDEVVYLRKVISEPNPPAEAYCALANFLIMQGKPKAEELVELCAKAVQIDPTLDKAVDIHTKYLIFDTKLDEAEKCCRKKIELDHSSPIGWRLLAVVLAKKGKAAEALETINQAKYFGLIKKDDLEFRVIVAEVALRNGERDALNEIEAIYDAGLYDGALAYDYGLANYLYGDKSKALPAVREAYEIRGQDKYVMASFARYCEKALGKAIPDELKDFVEKYK